MIFNTYSWEVALSVSLAGPSSSGNTFIRSIFGTVVLDALASKMVAVFYYELYSVLIFFPFELPMDFDDNGPRASFASAFWD